MDEETREIHKLEMKILDVEQTVLIKVSALETAVISLNATVQQLVRKEAFAPVAYIAYGLAGGVLTSALTAVMAMIWIK